MEISTSSVYIFMVHRESILFYIIYLKMESSIRQKAINTPNTAHFYESYNWRNAPDTAHRGAIIDSVTNYSSNESFNWNELYKLPFDFVEHLHV